MGWDLELAFAAIHNIGEEHQSPVEKFSEYALNCNVYMLTTLLVLSGAQAFPWLSG